MILEHDISFNTHFPLVSYLAKLKNVYVSVWQL